MLRMKGCTANKPRPRAPCCDYDGKLICLHKNSYGL